MREEITNPSVAQAIPISLALGIPCFSANVGAHAMLVPWPPSNETEPPS